MNLTSTDYTQICYPEPWSRARARHDNLKAQRHKRQIRTPRRRVNGRLVPLGRRPR